MASKNQLDTRLTAIALVIGATWGIAAWAFGIHQKWNSAFLLVFVPFLVIGTLPRRKRRPSYWTAFCLCVCFQALLVWLVFAVVLQNVEVVGMLYAVPVGMIEVVIIYAMIGGLERWISK